MTWKTCTIAPSILTWRSPRGASTTSRETESSFVTTRTKTATCFTSCGRVSPFPKAKPSTRGNTLGEIGFSGTATVYAHLDYQLMDGPDFMHAQALPVQFSDVTLIRGQKQIRLPRTVPETGDFLFE